MRYCPPTGCGPMGFYDPMNIAVELTLTMLVLVICLIIYFKTSKLEELTEHKGIKYFRRMFLFFGIAFSSKFLIGIIHLVLHSLAIFKIGYYFKPLPLIVTAYFSTVAIFYLVLSILWKKIELKVSLKKSIILIHLFSLLLALGTLVFKIFWIIPLIQIVIILFLGIILFITNYKKRKIKNNNTKKLLLLYSLLLLGWIVSLYTMGPAFHLPPGTNIIAYLIVISIFLVILHRISKFTK